MKESVTVRPVTTNCDFWLGKEACRGTATRMVHWNGEYCGQFCDLHIDEMAEHLRALEEEGGKIR